MFYTIFEKLVWGTFHIFSNENLSFEDYVKYSQECGMKNNIRSTVYTQIKESIINFDKYIKFKQFLYTNTNRFLDNDIKNEYNDYFILSQKYYHALNKFAFICKTKISKIGCITDMYMNPIDKNKNNYIEIVHEKAKYAFTYSDIIKIIHKSLHANEELYAEPNPIKNPYNNLPFLKSHLYHIYFSIKKSDYNIPNVFQQFFISNFSIANFLDKHEFLLRDKAIAEKCNSTDNIEELYDVILEMIETYNDCHPALSINIHSNIPKNIIINVFRPYLKYYYKSMYSLNAGSKNAYKVYYKSLLKHFASQNKMFGRRIVHRETDLNKKKKVRIQYNTEHSPFVPAFTYDTNKKDTHIEYIKKESDFVLNYRNMVEKYALSTLNDLPNYANVNRVAPLTEQEDNVDDDDDDDDDEILFSIPINSNVENTHIRFEDRNIESNVNNVNIEPNNAADTENMVGLYNDDDDDSNHSDIDIELISSIINHTISQIDSQEENQR